MSSISHRASISQALYYEAATVHQQLNSKFVWTTSMRVLTLHTGMHVCDVCAMIREHVACAATADVMFKVNNITTQQESLLTTNLVLFSFSTNTAAYAPCFLQHKL